MRKLLVAAAVVLMAGGALAQFANQENMGGSLNPENPFYLLRDRVVSAAATQTQKVYELRSLSFILDIHAACSAGTAALTVEGSSDNTNWLVLDSIVAAATQIKHYNANTVGAGIALTPLAFRWVRITVASCGASNTSTLTVAAK